MALNSRQKRARKRKLALALLAHSRNPPMVAQEGHVRAVWGKTLPPRAAIRERPWEGSGTRGKSSGGKVIKPKKPLYRLDGIKTGLIDVDAPTAKRTSLDTLRLKAAKTQLAKRNSED